MGLIVNTRGGLFSITNETEDEKGAGLVFLFRNCPGLEFVGLWSTCRIESVDGGRLLQTAYNPQMTNRLGIGECNWSS